MAPFTAASVVTLCLAFPPTWKAGRLQIAKSSLTHRASRLLKVWSRAFPPWAVQNAWRGKACIMEGEGLGAGSGAGALRGSCVCMRYLLYIDKIRIETAQAGLWERVLNVS